MLETKLIQFGAPLLANLIGQRFGKGAELVANQALGVLVQTLGLDEGAGRDDVDRFLAERPTGIATQIAEAEKRMPELLIAQAQASTQAAEAALLEQQMSAMVPTDAKPLWAWAWLYLWQYLLMLFWLWGLVGVHVANTVWGQNFPGPAITDLLTLTGLYLGLHMGGHTALEMMRGKWGRGNEDGAK